MYKATNTHR